MTAPAGTTAAAEHPNYILPETQAQEKAWALAAQKGDRAAFMHIVDAYQRPVYEGRSYF